MFLPALFFGTHRFLSRFLTVLATTMGPECMRERSAGVKTKTVTVAVMEGKGLYTRLCCLLKKSSQLLWLFRI